jgi:hypothetical protein
MLKRLGPRSASAADTELTLESAVNPRCRGRSEVNHLDYESCEDDLR